MVDEDPDEDGNPVVMNLRFPGQYFDDETGLHYNYFRDYHPGIGRYLEPDPRMDFSILHKLFAASGTWFFGYLDFDLYPYCSNNPVRWIDLSGLTVTCVYSQSTGSLICFEDTILGLGEKAVDTKDDPCYSGTGPGRNNPEMQTTPFVGPIPRGLWEIGTHQERGTGPLSLPLTPLPGNDVFDTQRDPKTFVMHGDSADPKRYGDVSRGCPVCRREFRRIINDLGGGRFYVGR
jgi:RHS repeat-associated protein